MAKVTRKKTRRLSKLEKRAVWARPDSNAGEGWSSRADQRAADLRHVRLTQMESEE